MKKKSGFLSAFGKAFEIFKAITDAVLALGGDDEDLEQIQKNPELLKKIALLIADSRNQVFHLMVNYDWPLIRLIVSGHYDNIDHGIMKTFSVKKQEKKERVAKLFYFSYKVTLNDVIQEMAKKGYEPANIAELCAFGEAYPANIAELCVFPQIESSFEVVALGSQSPFPGRPEYKCFPLLCCKDNKRNFGMKFLRPAHLCTATRFLAVRKQAA